MPETERVFGFEMTTTEEEVALHEPDCESESVEEYLDLQNLLRLEHDRIVDDLYPEGKRRISDVEEVAVHKDTDAIQVWLRTERAKDNE